jgi:hypothetical protein
MGMEPGRTIGTLGRIALALTAGIATGALLVAAYIYSSLGEALVFEGLFLVSLFYGAAIATICVPIWLVLARVGWNGALAAAALGFVATTLFLVLTEAAGGHQQLELMAYTFLPYAACGAIAALVTRGVGGLLTKA